MWTREERVWYFDWGSLRFGLGGEVLSNRQSFCLEQIINAHTPAKMADGAVSATA